MENNYQDHIINQNIWLPNLPFRLQATRDCVPRFCFLNGAAYRLYRKHQQKERKRTETKTGVAIAFVVPRSSNHWLSTEALAPVVFVHLSASFQEKESRTEKKGKRREGKENREEGKEKRRKQGEERRKRGRHRAKRRRRMQAENKKEKSWNR
ncbi:hypothetical protein NC652_027299 [Populus alba x Populus x berolinensis]|nr:hypothetical protein NC652_027299 [Populus alba x Populus x berolinensis]